jgi:hypothetical protein
MVNERLTWGPISKRPENLYVELLNYTLYCDCRHIASTDIRCYAYNSAKGLQYYEYPYHAMRPLNIFEAFRERRRKRREQALRI